MQQINLVDPRLLPPQRRLSGATLVALVAAATLAVATHYQAERLWTAQLASAVAPADATAATPGPTAATPDAAADATTVLVRQIAQREALRDLMLNQAEPPPDSAALIQDLVAALPETLWLTEIDIAGARALRISGGTLEPAALVTFADRLARIPALRSLPIETVRLEPLPDEQGDASPTPARPAHRFVLASAAAPAAVDTR
jgi:hypothetical protein